MFKRDPIFWWASGIFILVLALFAITQYDVLLMLIVFAYLLRPALASFGLAKKYVDERQMSLNYRSSNIAFVVTIILWKVIPTFATLFEGLGAQLPLPTRITIAISRFLGRWMPVIVLLIGLAIFAVFRYHKTYSGRRRIDSIILRIPIIGLLLRKIAVARFCRTLATLTSSGVPILEGLEITAKTSGNAVVQDAVMDVRKEVEQGRTIHEPLGTTSVFPSMVIQMIAVGESTGALDAMLNKIADFYDEEVDAAVEALTSLIEPFMMIFLGGMIGGLIIAMYLPIFKIAGTVQ